MTKNPELTDFERGMIIGLHRGNFGPSAISKVLGYPRTTISTIIKRYNEDNMTTTASRSGRPPLLDDRAKRKLVHEVKKDRKRSLDELKENFNVGFTTTISSRTIQRAIHEEGFYGRVGKRKPFVSDVNKKKRLSWCKERKNWHSEWNNIIWSDESRFLLYQNDAHHYVWRQTHEKYDTDCLLPTFKSGNQGVMVWGCFTKNFLGPLVIIEGKISGNVYKKLLEDNLLPFINRLGEENAYFFQDDNAPVHRANLITAWKAENLISSIPWPAQSPDLNPIENLWDQLERRVRNRLQKPKNLADLIDALKEEWNKIDINILNKLVESMPRRVKAVLESKGNPTPY
jgi:transposase